MTDARLPERWLNDRRLLKLPDDAFRLFATSLMWSVANKTDGVLYDIEQERQRRANTMRYFEAQGLVKGRDWYWGTLDGWNRPGVVDMGEELGVNEELKPKDPNALPIMIRSSGVRILGGPRIAASMDAGMFPSEMPFAIGIPHGQSLS